MGIKFNPLLYQGFDFGGSSPDGGVTGVGVIDSQSASPNGLVISGTTIYAQSASATNPGMVNNAAQTLSGVKTLNNELLLIDGSVSTPSWGFGSDTNTGMYKAATSSIGFTGAGAALATITNVSGAGHFSFPSAASQIFLGGSLASDAAPAFFGIGGLNLGNQPSDGGPAILFNGSSGGVPQLWSITSNGTASSPTATTTGQILAEWGFYGYGTTTYQNGALFLVQASGAWSDATHVANITLSNSGSQTFQIGAAGAFNMQVGATRYFQMGSAGTFNMGNTTAASTAAVLSVQGTTANFTGGVNSSLLLNSIFPSTNTGTIRGITNTLQTAAAAYTVVNAVGYSTLIAKGAGSSITRLISFLGDNTANGTNGAVLADNVTFTGGQWFLNNSVSSFPSTLAGAVTITNNTASTTTGTGALIVTGGMGTGGAHFVGGDVSTAGNLIASAAGKGLQVKTGSNARAGTSTLTGGTVVVSNTSVGANTIVLLNQATLGGTPGTLTYTKSNGVSFTITSTSGADTSTVVWMLVEAN